VSSLVEQKFGVAAADYAASTVHAHGPSLARAVALVTPQSGWQVLDVATGAGHTALAFAPLVKRVLATDLTREMLEQTRSLAAARGLSNVETARMDAAALATGDETFDLATCRLAAHHFPDPAAFVCEVWRVLVPGGTFALIDNISPEQGDDALAYNAYETLRDPSHARCLALGEWLTLLKKTGFADLRWEVLDQDIGFDAWTKRMRCAADTVGRLNAMLAQEPLRTVLNPRLTDEGFTFTLKEAIVVAHKGARK
jgi:ubiquinone/menaquinone biosynthesis C-methylase UbiE